MILASREHFGTGVDFTNTDALWLVSPPRSLHKYTQYAQEAGRIMRMCSRPSEAPGEEQADLARRPRVSITVLAAHGGRGDDIERRFGDLARLEELNRSYRKGAAARHGEASGEHLCSQEMYAYGPGGRWGRGDTRGRRGWDGLFFWFSPPAPKNIWVLEDMNGGYDAPLRGSAGGGDLETYYEQLRLLREEGGSREQGREAAQALREMNADMFEGRKALMDTAVEAFHLYYRALNGYLQKSGPAWIRGCCWKAAAFPPPPPPERRTSAACGASCPRPPCTPGCGT